MGEVNDVLCMCVLVVAVRRMKREMRVRLQGRCVKDPRVFQERDDGRSLEPPWSKVFYLHDISAVYLTLTLWGTDLTIFFSLSFFFPQKFLFANNFKDFISRDPNQNWLNLLTNENQNLKQWYPIWMFKLFMYFIFYKQIPHLRA